MFSRCPGKAACWWSTYLHAEFSWGSETIFVEASDNVTAAHRGHPKREVRGAPASAHSPNIGGRPPCCMYAATRCVCDTRQAIGGRLLTCACKPQLASPHCRVKSSKCNTGSRDCRRNQGSSQTRSCQHWSDTSCGVNSRRVRQDNSTSLIAAYAMCCCTVKARN